MNKAKSALRELNEMTLSLKGFRRSPRQTNRLFTSDCEILKLHSEYLCISTDSIGEEIDLAIYEDPETWGWMTVMSSVSDLTVTVAKPLGLLLANQWKYGTSTSTKKKFLKGAHRALLKSDVHLLGGDSGNGESHCHTSTIVGVSPDRPLTRLGIRPGDFICIVGQKRMGLGPSLALSLLFDLPGTTRLEKIFRPLPPLKMMRKLKPFIRASIDTSDGLASSLKILSELNQVGFELKWSPQLIHPEAAKFCAKNHLHPLMLWMNDLGDLQPLIAVSPTNLQKVLKKSRDVVVLGRAVRNSETASVEWNEKVGTLPLAKITQAKRTLSDLKKVMRNLNQYFLKNF